MKKIVIINGYNGVGKNEFVKKAKGLSQNIFEIDTAKDYKEITKIYYGWNGVKKDDKTRKLIYDLKKLAIEYNDIPFCNACSMIDEIKNCENYIVFIHCREPKEIKKIVDKYNSVVLLIDRMNSKPANNGADMSVKMTYYDYIVDNYGSIKELEQEAKSFIKWLERSEKMTEMEQKDSILSMVTNKQNIIKCEWCGANIMLAADDYVIIGCAHYLKNCLGVSDFEKKISEYRNSGRKPISYDEWKDISEKLGYETVSDMLWCEYYEKDQSAEKLSDLIGIDKKTIIEKTKKFIPLKKDRIDWNGKSILLGYESIEDYIEKNYIDGGKTIVEMASELEVWYKSMHDKLKGY